MFVFLVGFGTGGAFGQEGEGEFLVEGEAQEQVVTVSNIEVEQQGEFLKLTYDLATSDNEPAHISGQFSMDGGETFTRFVKAVSGDVNNKVNPGTDRCFVWDFAKDAVACAIEQVRVRIQGGPLPGVERESAASPAGFRRAVS